MVIVTFFVDDHGSCTMQVAKLAKFLSRSERAILAAYKQLEADGIIIVRSDSPGTVTSVVRETPGRQVLKTLDDDQLAARKPRRPRRFPAADRVLWPRNTQPRR